MAVLAQMLVIFPKRPVINRSGLNGNYDFDVKRRAPESSGGQTPGRGFGAVFNLIFEEGSR